jgi:hypothetical protein
MFKLLSRGSIARKIFLSYLALFISVLFSVGMLCFLWTAYIVRSQIEDTCRVSLDNTRNLLNQRVDELEDFASTLAKTYWIRKVTLMNSSTIDYSRIDHIELRNHLLELDNYTEINDFIYEIAVYLDSKDTILYPNGSDTSDWFFKYKYEFEEMGKEDWLKLLKPMQPSDNSKIIGPYNCKNYGNIKNIFVYMKVLPITKGIHRATLLVMIDEKKVADILRSSFLTDASIAYIINDKNEIITSVNGNKKFDRIVSDGNFKESKLIFPRFVKDNSGNKYFTFRSSSDSITIPWHYIIFVPASAVMNKVYYIQYATLFICSILLFIGALFSYRFTKNNYAPVHKLTQMIKETVTELNNNAAVCKNEYNLIEEGIKTIFINDANMKKKMEMYNDVALKNQFMKFIYEGCSCNNNDSSNKECASIVDKFSRPFYTVAIFDWGSKQQYLPDSLEHYTWSAFGIKHGSQVIYIINTDDTAESDIAVNTIKSEFGNEFTIGMGCTYNLCNLQQSYNEAIIAIDHKLLKGENGVIRFVDLKLNCDKIYYYPVNFEHKLLQYIYKKDITKVREALKKSITCHLKQSNLSLSSMVGSVITILGAVFICSNISCPYSIKSKKPAILA